jgi:hypothetical protein
VLDNYRGSRDEFRADTKFETLPNSANAIN